MATPSPTPEQARNRLPNLFEVLSRRTMAPVDLFSFYIYMRDQQRSVDYLDFWLDVSQHMSLCRHYVRELRRSVLIDTPELEKGSKRSSSGFDGTSDSGLAGPSGTNNEKTTATTPDQRLSAFLRSETQSRHSPTRSQDSNTSGTPATTPGGMPRPAFAQSNSNSGSPATGTSGMTPSGMDTSSPGNISSSPQHTVNRADIRASAEKILYTFLLPGSEREIILPQGILNQITTAIEEQGRDDPEVFDDAKDYVFQAMERDAFPGFLRSKALGNIVPPSMMLRLIIGLLSLFGAFWTAFVLIFLDYSRATRCWEILPFTVGVYALATHQYMLDPIVGLAGLSEYTILSFHKIREGYVRKLIAKRSLMVLATVILIDTALCCLFILVPGKRL